jgi:hypothetical protein
MRVLIFGAALAATLGVAYADAPCTTIADNSQAIRLLDGLSVDSIFTGPDAKDFFSQMIRLIGPMPSNPSDLNAVSTHVHLGGDGEKMATVHFYVGAARCDAGFDADMTPGLLNLIVGKVGVRI